MAYEYDVRGRIAAGKQDIILLLNSRPHGKWLKIIQLYISNLYFAYRFWNQTVFFCWVWGSLLTDSLYYVLYEVGRKLLTYNVHTLLAFYETEQIKDVGKQ